MKGSDSHAIVDDIRALWEMATPIATISRKFHLPVRTIQAVIQDGQIPEVEPEWPSSAIQADGESKR